MLQRKFPIRPGDLPRIELLALADKTIKDLGGPEKAKTFFKFTCPNCGERCTFITPFMLYERGVCNACGMDAPVEYGGFTVELQLGEFNGTHSAAG